MKTGRRDGPSRPKRSSTGLEVTYLGGRPEVAYLYVPRSLHEYPRSGGCIEAEPDMLLEVDEDGKLMGIEFLSPELATPDAVNRALAANGFDPIDAIHLRPLTRPFQESKPRTGELAVSYKDGRLWAAYLHLTRRKEKSAGSRRVSDEMIIDVDRRGNLIGIEFLSAVELVQVNLLLMEHGLESLPESQLRPILLD